MRNVNCIFTKSNTLKGGVLLFVEGAISTLPRQVKRVSLPVRALSSKYSYLGFKLGWVCSLDSNG